MYRLLLLIHSQNFDKLLPVILYPCSNLSGETYVLIKLFISKISVFGLEIFCLFILTACKSPFTLNLICSNPLFMQVQTTPSPIPEIPNLFANGHSLSTLSVISFNIQDALFIYKIELNNI